MKTHTRTIVAVAALLVSGLALANGAADKDTQDPVERVCIDSRLVRDFDALSDRHIVVQERRDNYYLLTTKNRCIGLRHALTIGLKDTTSRICSNRVGGEIIYRDFERLQRGCWIDTIVPVENKDEARAIVDEQEQHDRQEKQDGNDG